MTNMYRENRKSLNAYVGCCHKCVYCVPSFQRQAKRRGKRCPKCYDFIPHFHPERLLKSPPKTYNGEFVFFPSMGDPTFAKPSDFQAMLDYARKYPNTTFLIQTKDPTCFWGYEFPDNVILGITLETNRIEFDTPSAFKTYSQISSAPSPIHRFIDFKGFRVVCQSKIITIEPILQFDIETLARWIHTIGSQVVYIGYDNHNCRLPEPTLEKTQQLIKHLEKFTEVRVKSLRKAWYEKSSSRKAGSSGEDEEPARGGKHSNTQSPPHDLLLEPSNEEEA